MTFLHVIKKNENLIINCILFTKVFIPWSKIIQFEVVTVKLSTRSFISISLSPLVSISSLNNAPRHDFLKNPRKHLPV